MIEYRVRPVVRYVITRYTKYPELNACGSSERLGEFDSEEYAETVAEALRYQQKERDRWDAHIAMECEVHEQRACADNQPHPITNVNAYTEAPAPIFGNSGR